MALFAGIHYDEEAGMRFKRPFTVLSHAFVEWLLCAATMGIGMSATTLSTTLIIHAIGAPIYFAAVWRFF